MKEKLIPVAYYDNIRELLDDIERKYGDAPAVTVFSRSGKRSDVSFSELAGDVRALAEALIDEGLSGSRIAIAGENSYEWVAAYLGVGLAGGTAVCIDIEQSDDMIRTELARADVSVAMVSASMAEVCGGLAHVIPLFGDSGIDALVKKGCALIEGGSRKYAEVELLSDHPLSVVFTSGTTSTPKPVVLSHRAVLTNASDALAYVSVGSRSFGVLPFYHAYGFTCAVMCSLIGGINICINGDLKTMVRDMELFRPHTIIAVPLIAEALHKLIRQKIEAAGVGKKLELARGLGRLLGDPSMFIKKKMRESFAGTALEALDLIMCGGAYLGKNYAQDLCDWGITVLLGYGITECAPLVTVNRRWDNDVRTVGRVLPHTKVKITDGEICVCGDNLMSGYLFDDGLTESSVTDGWFMTGDMGYFDRRGYMHITGRKKNLIVMKNGKKISPEEIEEELMKCPLVKEVMAYGAVSGQSEDDVKIAVMVYPDPETTAGMSTFDILAGLQEFVDGLNGRLPVYKQVQMINLREDEFAKTAAKKVIRETP